MSDWQTIEEWNRERRLKELVALNHRPARSGKRPASKPNKRQPRKAKKAGLDESTKLLLWLLAMALAYSFIQ